jgi:multiple sugar transport system permease protein
MIPPLTAAPLRQRARARWAPYAFAAPFVLLFAAFYLVPIGYAVWESLQKTVRTGGFAFSVARTTFAGFSNYQQVLTDPAFRSGLVRVVAFGLVQVPVMLGTALVLALLIDSGRARFARFFRLAYFLPYALPGVIAAIIWGFLYSPGISPISQLLSHTPAGNVNFLGPGIVLFSIGNIVTWSWTGYNMLIIFSALQAIPQDIFGAARIDGASEWRIALRIKVPMLVPAMVLTCVFSIIGTLQLFTEPQVLSKLTGTISSSYTPNLMAYTAAFVTNNTYFAAAISVTLALVTFVLSFAMLRLTWRRSLGGVT